MKSLVLFAMSLLLSFLLLSGSVGPLLMCVLLFLDILFALAALSFFVASMHLHSTRARTKVTSSRLMLLEDGLPSIPLTIREILAKMDFTQFEYFSAAVVIGLREGHRFEKHCGGSGDQGVDVKLRNAYGLLVAVQSKLYTPGNPVGSEEIRAFLGSLLFHQATYGFFVTTSTFTRDARRVIESTNGRIRAIDGRQLEAYLQWRTREMKLAWREIEDALGGASV